MDRNLHGGATLAVANRLYFIIKKRDQIVGASTALVVLAALCWGLSGGIGGILMADGWAAFVVSFYRGAIGLLFVLGLSACGEPGDEAVPPQEPAPGAVPPAE
jgi:drug/metabolite transporter (DMT)-like permease